MEDCVFCDIIEGKMSGKIVYQDEDVIALEDIGPQAPVHILVMPKKHIPTLLDLTEDDEKLIGKIVLVANEIATKYNIGKNGFRIVFNCNKDAGQSVPHIHMHLMGGRRFAWPPG